MIHSVEIGGEDGGFAPAGAGANFHDRVAFVAFIGRKKSDLDLEFQIGDTLFQSRNFLLRHLGEIGVFGRGEFTIVFQLAAGGLQFLPFREQTAEYWRARAWCRWRACDCQKDADRQFRFPIAGSVPVYAR